MGEVMSCIKGQVRVSSSTILSSFPLGACLTHFQNDYLKILSCEIHFYSQVLTIPDFLKLFGSLAAVSINSNQYYFILIKSELCKIGFISLVECSFSGQSKDWMYFWICSRFIHLTHWMWKVRMLFCIFVQFTVIWEAGHAWIRQSNIWRKQVVDKEPWL